MSGGLLLQAFVYLAAAVIAVPVAKRLGLGSVLGYLIAGVLIGPSVLRLVGGGDDVLHVAEFGVVMLLFIIGLEVRPALLWSLRHTIFGLGLAQMAGSAVLIGGIALAVGLPLTQAVAVGLILAMSSTAIALQILDEKGLRRGAVGMTAFGVLLFQDLSVIPILAVLPLLAGAAAAEGGGLLAGQPGWLHAIAVVAAVGAVIAGGRYLIRPVFRWIALAKLREVFTAFALLLVVGVALGMQAVGLSPALGAFVAGVVLADSEFRRELETDIEPFRGLLLGLFFISVGAGLDLPLVIAQPVTLAAVVLGLMALKTAVMFAAGRIGRLSWRDAGSTGVILSQGGEFAFVLLAAAVASATLPAALASLLTAAVALSMAATPLLVLAWERLTRTAPRPFKAPEDNAFDVAEPPVILAGSGRFGQIVARVLNTQRIPVAVLDSSIEQIELLRRFDRRVYYGDAGRLDLLRAAGAESARLLVVAIDDPEKAREIVEAAKEAFPHLRILARAFDRRHAYDLLNAGADVVERETFEGGLAMAHETLKALGWRAWRAERATRLFRRHDERQFQALRPLWGDEERFTVAARESSPRMEELLRSDLDRMTQTDGSEDGWTAAAPRRLHPRPPSPEPAE